MSAKNGTGGENKNKKTTEEKQGTTQETYLDKLKNGIETTLTNLTKSLGEWGSNVQNGSGGYVDKDTGDISIGDLTESGGNKAADKATDRGTKGTKSGDNNTKQVKDERKYKNTGGSSGSGGTAGTTPTTTETATETAAAKTPGIDIMSELENLKTKYGGTNYYDSSDTASLRERLNAVQNAYDAATAAIGDTSGLDALYSKLNELSGVYANASKYDSATLDRARSDLAALEDYLGNLDYYTAKTPEEIRAEAEGEYTSYYNQLRRSAAQAQQRQDLSLAQQKGQLQAGYDRQREASDREYRNAYSQSDRQMLSRGMQRSSYTANTLANIDLARVGANQQLWESQRQAEENIEQQRQLLAAQLAETMQGYDNDQAADIMKRVREIQNEEFERNREFQQYQAGLNADLYDKKLNLNNLEYERQQYANELAAKYAADIYDRNYNLQDASYNRASSAAQYSATAAKDIYSSLADLENTDYERLKEYQQYQNTLAQDLYDRQYNLHRDAIEDEKDFAEFDAKYNVTGKFNNDTSTGSTGSTGSGSKSNKNKKNNTTGDTNGTTGGNTKPTDDDLYNVVNGSGGSGGTTVGSGGTTGGSAAGNNIMENVTNGIAEFAANVVDWWNTNVTGKKGTK